MKLHYKEFIKKQEELFENPSFINFENNYYLLFHNFIQRRGTITITNGEFLNYIYEINAKNHKNYLKGQINFLSYSMMIMVNYLFELLLLEERIDEGLIIFIVGNFFEATLDDDSFLEFQYTKVRHHFFDESCSTADFETVVKDILNSPRPDLDYLRILILENLLVRDKVDILKKIIVFQSSAHIDKFDKCIKESDTFDNWLKYSAELLPYTELNKFLPIYDIKKNENPKIELVQDDDGNIVESTFSDGCEKTILPYINQIFTSDEIDEIEENYKFMSELFANLNFDPVLLKETIKDTIETTFAIFDEHGYLEAKKYLLVRYKSKLSIPKFLFEEISKLLIEPNGSS